MELNLSGWRGVGPRIVCVLVCDHIEGGRCGRGGCVIESSGDDASSDRVCNELLDVRVDEARDDDDGGG